MQRTGIDHGDRRGAVGRPYPELPGAGDDDLVDLRELIAIPVVLHAVVRCFECRPLLDLCWGPPGGIFYGVRRSRRSISRGLISVGRLAIVTYQSDGTVADIAMIQAGSGQKIVQRLLDGDVSSDWIELFTLQIIGGGQNLKSGLSSKGADGASRISHGYIERMDLLRGRRQWRGDGEK